MRQLQEQSRLRCCCCCCFWDKG